MESRSWRDSSIAATNRRALAHRSRPSSSSANIISTPNLSHSMYGEGMRRSAHAASRFFSYLFYRLVVWCYGLTWISAAGRPTAIYIVRSSLAVHWLLSFRNQQLLLVKRHRAMLLAYQICRRVHMNWNSISIGETGEDDTAMMARTRPLRNVFNKYTFYEKLLW